MTCERRDGDVINGECRVTHCQTMPANLLDLTIQCSVV